MAELKTAPTRASVTAFINSVEDETKRRDSRKLLALMKAITGSKPVMWGSSIVGFGSYRYRYQSGREGDWFFTGFSPRKKDLTLYIMPGLERFPKLLKRLGKHRTGKSCLYINKLDDVDMDVLEELIREGVAWLRDNNPDGGSC